jgi:hypothetical protein
VAAHNSSFNTALSLQLEKKYASQLPIAIRVFIYHPVSCFCGRKSADGRACCKFGACLVKMIFFIAARRRRRSRYISERLEHGANVVVYGGAEIWRDGTTPVLIILHVRVSQPSLVAPPLFTAPLQPNQK